MAASTKIISLEKILSILPELDLIPLIEHGFLALSSNSAIIPPVGELLFDQPPGETHIKYGYIKGEEFYTIKVASGFYQNPELGLSSSQGLMLLLSQKTGKLLAILLDDGKLTDIRTAIASMITLKYMAQKKVSAVGIIGTGIQAGLQLRYLDTVCNCKNVFIWGRDRAKAQAIKDFYGDKYSVTLANSVNELTENCNVIITTTSAKSPLLKMADIKPGTHITALGSDTAEKMELDPSVFLVANCIVSDSIEQSKTRGEIYHARLAGFLDPSKLVELGKLISNPGLCRKKESDITVADLTGVAVQDIMIATAVYNHYNNINTPSTTVPGTK